MSSLYKIVQENPNDKSLIYKLEKEMKSNFSKIIIEYPYNGIAFADTFAEFLININKIKTYKELKSKFKSIYHKHYEDLSSKVAKQEGDFSDPVKISQFHLNNLEPQDYLLLYKYLNSTDRSSLSPRMIETLSKIRTRPNINPDTLSKLVNNINLSSLYLIRELGIRKFLEFSNLIDSLGVYYPIKEIPDSRLCNEVKKELINNFTSSIDKNFNMSSIDSIEKLLF